VRTHVRHVTLYESHANNAKNVPNLLEKAYEIPLLVTVLSLAVLSGSLNIIEIAEFQITSGVWNIFLLPLGAALFMITMVAEVERIPFDMLFSSHF